MTVYKPDFIQLEALVVEGYLSKKVSECGGYFLYNYTDYCTFEKKWNKHTENSRGTVYEKGTGRVVARAFPKFYNFSELAVSKQRNILKQTNFEVFTKEDGSMITLAHYGDEWRTHTRGSFNSDQAIKAKEMLHRYNLDRLDKNVTYIFEVIYPENKIVVNYGDKEELILLAAFDTKTGKEKTDVIKYGLNITFPIAQSHKFKSIQEVIDYTQTLDANNEGFVVRLSTGERFKLKSPEYLKIARILSRMSPLVLWESMVEGKVSTELMMSIPEEFRDVYEQFRRDLEYNYRMEMKQADEHYSNVMIATRESSREELNKSIGIYMSKNTNKFNPYVFPILNNKFDNLDKMIMKSIRPTGNIL